MSQIDDFDDFVSYEELQQLSTSQRAGCIAILLHLTLQEYSEYFATTFHFHELEQQAWWVAENGVPNQSRLHHLAEDLLQLGDRASDENYGQEVINAGRALAMGIADDHPSEYLGSIDFLSLCHAAATAYHFGLNGIDASFPDDVFLLWSNPVYRVAREIVNWCLEENPSAISKSDGAKFPLYFTVEKPPRLVRIQNRTPPPIHERR